MTTTGTELELRRNGHVEREWVEVMAPALELAKHVAGTEFVPKALRDNPAAIVAAIMYGDELGLGPMQSLAKIAMIDGKPSLSAEAQRALVLAAGHELWIEEATATKVTVSGRRSDSDRTSSVTWTLDDAKRAGLAGRTNWRSYPRQMLTARATAELARMIFADVIGGLAATEELEGLDEFDTAPLPAGAAPESGSTTRKRAGRKRKAPALEAGETGQPGTPDAGTPPAGPELPPLPDEPAAPLVDPDSVTAAPDSAQSPAEEPLTIGDVARGADATAGEEATDAETTAEPQSELDSDNSPAEKVDGATDDQKKALNALVGRLRDTEIELEDGSKSRVLSTEQLWAAAARRRNVDVDTMIELLSGRDEAGVLHWSPLRDSLTKAEASDLIASLSDRARHWGVE